MNERRVLDLSLSDPKPLALAFAKRWASVVKGADKYDGACFVFLAKVLSIVDGDPDRGCRAKTIGLAEIGSPPCIPPHAEGCRGRDDPLPARGEQLSWLGNVVYNGLGEDEDLRRELTSALGSFGEKA